VSYTVHIENKRCTINNDMVLVILPEISEQFLFPIDINIYIRIYLSLGENRLEETILIRDRH